MIIGRATVGLLYYVFVCLIAFAGRDENVSEMPSQLCATLVSQEADGQSLATGPYGFGRPTFYFGEIIRGEGVVQVKTIYFVSKVCP